MQVAHFDLIFPIFLFFDLTIYCDHTYGIGKDGITIPDPAKLDKIGIPEDSLSYKKDIK